MVPHSVPRMVLMRHGSYLVVTGSSSEDKIQANHWFSGALLLLLTGITVGCGAASQSGNTANSQIALAVSAPQAKVGVAYNVVPSVSGGAAPYIFTLVGNPPPGITVNQRTGSITGVPTIAGDYSFTLSVSDPPRPDHGASTVTISVASASSQNNQRPSIKISPETTTLVSQAEQQFSASVTGTSNTAVTWTASAGTIDSTGKFTAPEVTSNTAVTITAVSQTEGSLHTTAAAVVTPPTPLAITTTALIEANIGSSYNTSLSATGGAPPYSWMVAAGTLPSGIQMQTASGILSGTTSVSGSYSFTAKVTDSAGKTSTRALTLPVSSASQSGFDGPAELPRVYIQTAMADTPAPGNTIAVNTGGNLQSALNSANCGDTITLQAGATFSGVFTFPAKNCDDGHWVMVRTSASDSTLPAEGSRLTPCYGGVSSLPGRPALNCASTTNVLAKLLMPSGGNTGPIVFAAGANHYRLIGLEITRAAGTGIVYALAALTAPGGTASNLILDRVWLHGTTQDETKKGFELGGMSYASAIDSTFTDIHCTAVSGACTDAAAVGGGSGNPLGPFKIVDNFLEASGENILFGGAASTTTPADIQISQNHFFKPLIWMQGQPGFVGGADGHPFIVKNLFELKNAQRVLLEANIMEYSWGGFSQTGFAILLTPVNQPNSTGANLCAVCQVTDVTIRYNTISHVGGGLQIATVLSEPGQFPALDGQRYSIHDITIDDINPTVYSGNGRFAEIFSQASNPLIQNLSINHVTAFASGLLSVSGPTSPQMANFTFTNSIFSVGIYPIWSANGKSTDCARYDVPLKTFNDCFTSSAFSNNALIGATSSFPPSSWPSGNFFPTTASALQFASYNQGIGGNYQLSSSSPYHNAGTDGKDLGADVSTILSETAGVY
jgi:hypothetical protein